MHLFFIDESNPPPAKPSLGGKRYFTLGAVAIPELNWHSLDRTLANIKSRWGIQGEIKWRFFSANNNKPNNPMRHLSKEMRDEVREEIFAALKTRRHVKCMAVVASVDDAFALPYVNSDDDLYFYCLKILTERFQYRIQDVNKEFNITRHGIVILDGRDPSKDLKIRELHDRLVTKDTQFSSTYLNLIEGLFISASHLSTGTQIADMVAGAAHHYFASGYKHWLERALPSFRKSATGNYTGFGIMFFPNTPWVKNERRRVEALTPSAR